MVFGSLFASAGGLWVMAELTAIVNPPRIPPPKQDE
jgi:hypothetical protein